jgi:nucleolar complex protein 2
VRSCKSTTAHTLPSINLLKNSATEVFCIDHSLAYQHAFGYIRQLAIHLRESMKAKTKVRPTPRFFHSARSGTHMIHPQEAYKQVYNWQFVHCIDFWTIVLARACGGEVMGQESELKSLIYPLVQVSLGAIR